MVARIRLALEAEVASSVLLLPPKTAYRSVLSAAEPPRNPHALLAGSHSFLSLSALSSRVLSSSLRVLLDCTRLYGGSHAWQRV